jgi:hypothetical protein
LKTAEDAALKAAAERDEAQHKLAAIVESGAKPLSATTGEGTISPWKRAQRK